MVVMRRRRGRGKNRHVGVWKASRRSMGRVRGDDEQWSNGAAEQWNNWAMQDWGGEMWEDDFPKVEIGFTTKV